MISSGFSGAVAAKVILSLSKGDFCWYQDGRIILESPEARQKSSAMES
jgi:hypothetical protein